MPPSKKAPDVIQNSMFLPHIKKKSLMVGGGHRGRTIKLDSLRLQLDILPSSCLLCPRIGGELFKGGSIFFPPLGVKISLMKIFLPTPPLKWNLPLRTKSWTRLAVMDS